MARMALHTVFPTTQLTQAVVFDSNLLFRKTEKFYNLPSNVHSDDTLFYFDVTKKIKVMS